MRSTGRMETMRAIRPWWATALILLGLSLAVLVLTSAAAAQVAVGGETARADRAPDSSRLVLEQTSLLWIEGTSNLHDWSCDTRSIDAMLRVTPADARAPVSTVPARIDEVTVVVPVETLSCSKPGMDGNLRKALMANDHPKIAFRMTTYDIAVEAADPVHFTVTAKGRLSIAGQSRPVTLQVLAAEQAGETLVLLGEIDLLMSDFDIKPPSALFGALKTGDAVKVQFELVAGHEEIARGLGTDAATLAAYLDRW